MKLVINFNSNALEGDCYKDAVLYTKGDAKNLKQEELGWCFSGVPLPNGSTPLAFLSPSGIITKTFTNKYLNQEVEIKAYFKGNPLRVKGMFDE